MDDNATHMPVLARMLQLTSGPVLELGGGLYSTPLIHAMCPDRIVDTYEHNPYDGQRWLREIEIFQSDTHDIIWLDNWGGWAPRQHYELALMDLQPETQRVPMIRAIAGCVDYIVVHDFEDMRYGYDSVVNDFPHVSVYKQLSPWTAVLGHNPIPT